MRKLILHLLVLLAAIAGPAAAQAPPPVPALPDTERRTQYAITNQSGPFDVGFAIYGDGTDYQNWLEVWLNGIRLTGVSDWTLSLASGSISTNARPLTNARITLSAASTGTLQIVGARRPRRTTQFNENQGVSARALNQAFTDIVAQNRETWDKINSVTGRAIMGVPGESFGTLPPPASRANLFLGFNNMGALALLTGPTGGGGGSSNVFVDVCSLAAFHCDGATDDTAALNAQITALESAGGGTMIFTRCALILGQITQATGTAHVRITGTGQGCLDMRFNAPVAKILTLGGGIFEIDHMIIKDGGSDCATFWRTTNTVVRYHDNDFIGTAPYPNSCNDVMSFGGLSGVGTGSDSAFQGYGSMDVNNTYINIRRPWVFNEAANAIMVVNPHVSFSSGNAATLAITAASNANPAVLTVASDRFQAGDTFSVTISGFTGSWTPANGTFVATATGTTTFSIPVNSGGFGAMAGSPVIPDGELVGMTSGPIFGQHGNVFLGGAYEMQNYAYFAKMANGSKNHFLSVGMYDEVTGRTLAYLQALGSYSGGKWEPISFGPATDVIGQGNSGIVRPNIYIARRLCSRPVPSTGCNDPNAFLSVLGATGITAANISGVAANFYIDFQGSGTNFIDGSLLRIRDFAGTNIATFAIGGANVTGQVIASTGFVSGASSGLTTTKTVRAAGGAGDCTMIFTGGLLTGGTC